MSSEELYYNLNLLINKNSSLKNVHVPKANFVILYNRESLYWLKKFISNNSSIQNIHDIQSLLKTDVTLSLINKTDEYYEYILPDDYFEFVNSKSEANKNKCAGIVYNYLVKPKELNVNIDNQHPSFEFEESLCNITDKKLRVYVNDYKIINTYLSYYLTPEKIDLEGYINFNNEYSKNINSTLDDVYQFQILDQVALEVFREFENINAFKISQNK